MKITDSMRKAIIGCVIGTLCVAAVGPILGKVLNKLPLVNKDIKIKDTSYNQMPDVYAKHFTLKQGELVNVRFRANQPNQTVYLKIIGKGTYDEEVAANSTGVPNGISGKYFILHEFSFGDYYTDITSDENVVSISNDGSHFLEFMGATVDDDNPRSVPGSYVLIVYGVNSTNADPVENVKFHLQMRIDGPGELLEDIATIAGWSLIGLCAGLLCYYLLKEFTGTGRRP